MASRKFSESTRQDSPYGLSLEQQFHDKRREETRTFGQRERFGQPYRSEKEEERGSERGRGQSSYRQSGAPRGRGRGGQDRGQDRPRSERESRGYGRGGQDRAQDKGQDREERYTRSKSPRSPRKAQKEMENSPEEEFEVRTKEVMLSGENIKEIRHELIEKMDGKNFTIVEVIVDPSHETSEYFAKSKYVDHLYTFTGKKNPELREKLEKHPNIQVIEESFLYTPSEVKSPFILFFYPYWLTSMDEKNTRDVYFKNIPLKSGSFDDILRIEKPDLFAFVIPKNVKVPDYYGVKEEMDLDAKVKLVFIQPSKKQISLFSNKPTGIRKETKLTEEEYEKNFEKFLRNLLSQIAKPETLEKIINKKTMPMWKKAFTHDTFDLNDNYEQLETIGDRVLELAFLKYLLRKFPELSPQEITEVKSKYMSKLYQGTTSRRLGFGDWIRVGNDVDSISILEDVFESFFGALFEIADMEIGDGVGYVLALKFLTLIFSEVEFDLSKAQGHPRSQIKEILEMLKLDPEIQEVNVSDKGTNVVLKLSDRTIQELVESEKMSPNTSNVIGVGFGLSKNSAVNLAYSNAIEYLESLGITRAWAEQQKEMMDLMMPELEGFIDDALNRMEKEGYNRIYLRTSRTSVKAGNVVVQLVGEYFDEGKGKIQKKILVSGNYPDIQTGKIAVVQKYASGK